MAKRETWERRGFSNPLKLTGVDYTILGVMPPNFHGLDDSTQLWVPMTTMGARLAADYPPTNPNYSADAAPLRDEFFGNLRQPLIVLLGAVGLVLVITCVNVANLLLVRLATRRREMRSGFRSARAAARSRVCSRPKRLRWRSAARRWACCWPAGSSPRSSNSRRSSCPVLCALAIGALPALLAAHAREPYLPARRASRIDP